MATLERIRKRSILLIIVVGLALAAFVLMDAVKSFDSNSAKDRMYIGSVNDTEIAYADFQARLDNQVEAFKQRMFQQTGSTLVDDNTLVYIREQVWNELVTRTLMEQEVDALGIKISSAELFDLIQGDNVSPMVMQIPAFKNPATGAFDRNQVIKFLKQLDQNAQQKQSWIAIENQIKEAKVAEKYQNLLRKSAYVTDLEAKNNVAETSSKATFDYVYKNFFGAKDSVNVSDSDMKNYFNEHKEEFKQNESRDVRYVEFKVIASKDDSLNAKSTIESVKKEFTQSKDEVSYAKLNSDGEINDRFQKEDELSSKYKEIINSEVGTVVGPYIEGRNYKVAKLVATAKLPDSVKVRHIFLTPTQQKPTLADVQTLADSLKKAIEGGAKFADVAKQYSADKATSEKGGDLGWIKYTFSKRPYTVAQIKEFNNAAFEAPKGKITIANSNAGVHMILVDQRGKLVNKAKVIVVERLIDASQKTRDYVYGQASKFAGKNGNYETFIKAAKEKGMQPRYATSVKRSDHYIAGLTSARVFVRAIYNENTEVDKLVKDRDGNPIFSFKDKFVVGVLTNETEEGYPSWKAVANQLKNEVRKEKLAEKFTAEFAEAAKSASSLDDVAEKLGVEVKTAREISFLDNTIPGLGMEPNVIAATVSLAEGKLSAPVKGNNGVYMLSLDNKTNVKAQEMGAVKQQLLSRAGYSVASASSAALKSAGEIVDKRNNFY